MKKVHKYKKEKKMNFTDIIPILPLILIISLCPLIVRLKPVELTGIRETFRVGQSVNADIFSYYKMIWFISLTFIGAIILIYQIHNKKVNIRKSKIYIPMIIYIVLVILSSIFSAYKDVVTIGFMDRYENVFVLMSYIISMFLAMNMVEDERQIKALLYSLATSAIIISVIGLCQYIGKNFFITDLGKKLILGNKYSYLSEQVSTTGQAVHSTLANSNYVGVYTSMLFPLFSMIAIQSKKILDKIYFGLTSIFLLFTLFASNSRAGLVAIAIYFLLALIIYIKEVFTSKIGIISIILIAMIVIGFNKYSEGKLYSRFLSIKDSLMNTKEVDFKDIILEENIARIVMDDSEIKIIYDKGKLDFYDASDNLLETNRADNRIAFINNDKYLNHSFSVAKYEGNLVLQSNIMSNHGRLNFNLIIDEDDNFKFMDTKGNAIDLKDIPHIGFRGNERSASGRGYIWSRTIPLLKENIVLGKGPDTFPIYFPQDDYIGKLIGFGRINVLVDKPHNLYLLVAINTGLLSAFAVVVILVIYMIQAINILFLRKVQDFPTYKVFGIGIFFSIVAYFITSFTNDSTVFVSPVFWVLLGLGFNINIRLDKLKE